MGTEGCPAGSAGYASCIAFVGMPGSGKSTVARQLAKRLGWVFADSDAQIEERVGRTIRAYFDREGEASFREVEAAVIDEASALRATVLATGGGVVLRADNRKRLRERCRVVYLKSSPDELHRRLRHDSSRPLLRVADPLARLRSMYEERDPLYREVAHFTVDTGRPSVSALVNMVLMQLELAGALDPSLARSPVDSSVESSGS
jgi:shikimate kinase